MKKVLAIVAIVMLVPFTAFGLEMMADTAMDDVTGQAGVSISIDNVQMDFEMDYLSWGDADGFAIDYTGDGVVDENDNNAGYVNITTMKMTNIVIDKLGVGGSNLTPIAGTFGAGPELVTGDATVSVMDGDDLSALTIDVGTMQLPDGSAGPTAVAIGVPTLTIYVGEIAPFDIMLDTDAGNVIEDFTGDPTGWTLGSIAVGGMQCDLKGGTVYIFAH